MQQGIERQPGEIGGKTCGKGGGERGGGEQREEEDDQPVANAVPAAVEAADRAALAGIWEAEPHLERCQCDYDELCHILEGTVRLTDKAGRSRVFAAGETFVVSAGFEGTWENLTPVRKVFFILGKP